MGMGRLAMMLPLCLSIAVVYKTTRCEKLREIPLSSLTLFVTIVGGMFSVGASLWLLFILLA